MRTYPKHLFDFLLKPFIWLIWEPFSLKRSHWWNWRHDICLPLSGLRITIPAALGAKPRLTWWDNLIQTNFSWSDAAVLEPVDYSGLYRLGYMEGKRFKCCSLLLKGQTAVLRGSRDVIFLGMSYPDDKPISLQFVKYVHKRDLGKIKLI